MNNQTWWGWAIKGLGGATSIVKMLVGERVPISRHWLAELRNQIERLRQLADQAETKTED